ncbi:MAG TPA: T9SS type A sorting domain-containing protein, partial [Bacteroidia bacterium]|nr:T9SS type A sorting domain-containing protein [Bacteroidia bacterium]
PPGYTAIARIPKSAYSSYLDTNRSIGPNNGDPRYSAYRYKLQYLDSCGNLSAMSPYHRSIFIQDQMNGNFNWNYYEIEGIGPLNTVNYILWRQNILTGVSSTVNGTSSNLMTDPSYAALATAGNVKWYVSTTGFNCNPSLKQNEAAAAIKTRTKSNNTNERQFPTKLEELYGILTTLQVYPNPAQEMIYLVSRAELPSAVLRITDLSGRLVIEKTISGQSVEIDTKELKNGVYILYLSPEGHKGLSRKLVIQH